MYIIWGDSAIIGEWNKVLFIDLLIDRIWAIFNKIIMYFVKIWLLCCLEGGVIIFDAIWKILLNELALALSWSRKWYVPTNIYNDVKVHEDVWMFMVQSCCYRWSDLDY